MKIFLSVFRRKIKKFAVNADLRQQIFIQHCMRVVKPLHMENGEAQAGREIKAFLTDLFDKAELERMISTTISGTIKFSHAVQVFQSFWTKNRARINIR